MFFVATGITDGELMAGVRYRAGGASTDSLVMRARSGTIRTIRSEHQLWKLRAYSAVNFDGDDDPAAPAPAPAVPTLVMNVTTTPLDGHSGSTFMPAERRERRVMAW